MDVAVVGAGRVGTAMAVLLRRAGHRIVAVAGSAATRERAGRFLPGVPVLPNERAVRGADVVLLGTPDTAIEPACSSLVKAGVLDAGTALAHLSGATGLEALASAEATGITVFSVHPLQSCPDVETSIARIPGSAFAVTARSEAGYELGERIATDAGGRPFRLEDAMKPLYHAAAVFASNYLVVLTAVAEELERAAGVPEPLQALEPIQRATLDNVSTLGPEGALTGPSVRGDAVTVERNLEALREHAPEAIPAYVALAELAVGLATRSGRLAEDGRKAVEEVLTRWR